jgi:ribosomal protein S18 acetylase RimI-like enzyme
MTTDIRQVCISDLDRCFEIESASYGAEGASKNSIETRIKKYPEGFLVLTVDAQVIGFINSGCSNSDELSSEEIKSLIGHEPNGKNLIVFSLVVDGPFRQKGYAKKLMERFVQLADSQNKQILLMCRKEHIGMYQQFGFVEQGLSNSTHGGVTWYEMSRTNT